MPELPPPAPDSGAPASVDELKALAHPLRWRILRLCFDRPLTNQELAVALDIAPATTLRHVRALLRHDFLAAEPVRTGARGALERPYRTTGRTWRLGFDEQGDGLVAQVDLAVLAAHRSEFLRAGPAASRGVSRGMARLNSASQEELARRFGALVEEFVARDDADGEQLSFLWSMIRRAD